MTGQERVNRYIEILDKEGKVNSSRNWGIFDKLSDDELSDDLKITECIKIINKCDKRMENNPNKYPEEIM